MKRTCKIVLSLLLVLAVLCGCQSGQQPDAPSGGQAAEDSVVIALDTNSEPEAGFDPAYGWGAGEHVHEPLIQSTLTVTDAGLNIGYDLATGYSVSDDGLTWTVTIRDDVSFTDGEPLTAEDVAFTYNPVKEASSVNDFTMLDYAEAMDDTTVLFHMTTPFSIWPYTMAIVGIVPEHAYDSATYGANPIGSGRYLLKQWDRGQQVILEANPDYYGAAPRRWTAIHWPPTARWTTGDLTCPPFPPGRTPTGARWATTLQPTCGCAGRSTSGSTGRR